MKYIGHYPSYREANERQLDLMAAEIEALVFYVPTGMDQVYLGRLPVYALFVPEESVEAAREVVRLIPDENHRCLYGCPHLRWPPKVGQGGSLRAKPSTIPRHVQETSYIQSRVQSPGRA